jgi:16S rRNA (uracil1498-N3)-methyltransferase
VGVPRFYIDVPLAATAEIELPQRIAHHARHVLRLRDGDPLVLFDGRGGEFRGELLAGAARAVLLSHDAVERESALQITLVQALVATDKLDWVVEKAVELGVARILLAPARRSVVQLSGARRERRVERLREIAIAACAQCGRNRIPLIIACDSLSDALLQARADVARCALLQPAAEQPLSALAHGASSIALAVGPEGGFDDREVALAIDAGFQPCRLGSRVLRTETAGLAALASLLTAAGEF